MRVLLTSPSMRIGGAERVVTMLAAGLAQRGHEIALAAPPGERDADLRDVPHLRIPLEEHGRAASGVIQTVAQMRRAIAHFEPDVVHAQNVKQAATARAASTVAHPGRRRRPVLATFHGVLPAEYRHAALLLRLADHVACVSQAVLENIVAAGLPGSHASLVRNAIEPPPPLDDTRRAELDREFDLDGRPAVAIVGRLVAQKAHQRFLVAAGLVAAARPDTRFLVVGDGPLRSQIEAQAEAAGLTGSVRFAGRRPDAREIIERAEVLVFSSDWEGLSIAALEALAAGTPVVSTDVEGMHELLAGGAGAVVPLDDGTALGQRLIEILDDEPRRLAMGHAGRELIARDFSLGAMIDAYVRLYERLAYD